jgi:AcrR family transcriptional regulator
VRDATGYRVPMSSLRGARERARSEVVADVVTVARRQLAEVGPAQLSLRSVARELGVVSSAVYRYVESRDELLTLLIVAAYDSLGEQAERAAAESVGRSPADRWVHTAEAIRTWALEHPHEYALLYGTPVPGYAAPAATSAPGTRVSYALVGIVRDAWADGRVSNASVPPVPAQLASDLVTLRDAIDLPAPDGVLVATLAAWSQLFGLLSFELFSQTRGVVTRHDELFVATARLMAEQIGLAGEA